MKQRISDIILSEVKGGWGECPKEGDLLTPVIKTNNMTYEGFIDYSDLTMRHFEKSKLKKSFLMNGDLLIEKSGGTKYHSVGYINYFDGEDNKFVCNNFVLALRPDSTAVRPKYLFHQLKYKYESGQFSDCYNKTTGIQNLQVRTYLSKEIRIPTFDEQDEVVKRLDDITQMILKQRNLLGDLDSLVKSRFIEMFGDSILNDKSWPTSAMSDCCQMKGTKSIPHKEKYWLLNLDKIKSETGEILGKDYVVRDEVGSSTFFFDKNYVLYSKLRPYLNKVIISDESGFATSELVPLKPGACLNSYYLAFLLRSKSFVNWIDSTSSGAKMPRASMSALRSFRVPLPPLELQNKFADFVHLVDKSRFDQGIKIKDLFFLISYG